MRTIYLISPIEAIFLASLLISTVQAGNRQEFAVLATTDEQEAPDIYGNIVVWQQFVYEYGDWDIYIADINKPADPLVLVIGDYNDQSDPAIYEDTIVWQDYIMWQDSADWDIRMADISDQNNPEFFAVTDIAYNNERKPAIHGNTVVWQDGNDGAFDIYGADITDPYYPAEFLVSGFDFNQQSPAIYRTTVVWQDDFYGDWDILAADIWQRNKPTEFSVSLFDNDQQNPAISRNVVVWQDNFFGDWDIYAASVSEDGKAVEFTIANDNSSQMNPDIDGNIVVWQDDRNNNWDIFGYNLTTHKEFQITDNPYDQTNPAISRNVVVWQDNRSGNWNIYAAVLDSLEIAKCTSRMAGDVNDDCKIDFNDFGVIASGWLECDLEPKEACWQ